MNFRKELPHSSGASVYQFPNTLVHFKGFRRIIGLQKLKTFHTQLALGFLIWTSLLLSSVTFAQPPVSWMHNYAGVSTTVEDSASYLVTGSDGSCQDI